MKRCCFAAWSSFHAAAQSLLRVLLLAVCAIAPACGPGATPDGNGGTNAGDTSANSVTAPSTSATPVAANDNATASTPTPLPAVTPREAPVNPSSSGAPSPTPTPRATPKTNQPVIREMPAPGKNPRADGGLNNNGQGGAGNGNKSAARPAPEKRVQCGSITCPTGQVCCNSSCGICTPPGDVCIQMVCN